MNGLGPIILGVGLQDGLNPCIFMACAIFILLGLWLKISSLQAVWFRIIFALVYVAGDIAFNFGPAQVYIFNKFFILFAKILYLIFGLGSFVLGILFLIDWYLLTRGLPIKELPDNKIKSLALRIFFAFFMTVILAGVLSAMATLWPVNTYFMLLGSEAFIRGQWHMAFSLVGWYALASMWPLWLLWAFLSIKNLRLSLFKIICASVFFTASTTIILIFK